MLDQTAKPEDWLGRSPKEDDELSVGSVRRLAAMLDQDPAPFKRGSELPESWYAILFGPTARQSIIGRDGHPKTGDDLLPPLHNTRPLPPPPAQHPPPRVRRPRGDVSQAAQARRHGRARLPRAAGRAEDRPH